MQRPADVPRILEAPVKQNRQERVPKPAIPGQHPPTKPEQFRPVANRCEPLRRRSENLGAGCRRFESGHPDWTHFWARRAGPIVTADVRVAKDRLQHDVQNDGADEATSHRVEGLYQIVGTGISDPNARRSPLGRPTRRFLRSAV